MTDCFALLNEPRRPWLATDALKAKFFARSAEVHPDRVHSAPEAERAAAQERYTALNAAFNTLREPKDRLQHLLELESGAKPGNIQSTPAELTDLFFEVGRLCRDVDFFLLEKGRANSPLLKVKMFQRAMDWTSQINALQQRLNAKRGELETELAAMNETWAAAPTEPEVRRAALPLARLEQLYRPFSFLSRWTAQLQERVVQLAF
ncbi:MAG: molecular chaperone HscB [Limisphaerales bacterium]|nr:MAG: molecular chaperone HscB [Limisphaerales bacterium]KAG0506660.1 MAG: molecular chaperone HscB [Limisphaerales bacterium]TXT47646.1 MAG: molecular chaperone HscB [Limisphaerales bacterium]